MLIEDERKDAAKPDKSVEKPGTSGGEDESSTEKNGDDSHLHENQKSRTLKN